MKLVFTPMWHMHPHHPAGSSSGCQAAWHLEHQCSLLQQISCCPPMVGCQLADHSAHTQAGLGVLGEQLAALAEAAQQSGASVADCAAASLQTLRGLETSFAAASAQVLLTHMPKRANSMHPRVNAFAGPWEQQKWLRGFAYARLMSRASALCHISCVPDASADSWERLWQHWLTAFHLLHYNSKLAFLAAIQHIVLRKCIKADEVLGATAAEH